MERKDFIEKVGFGTASLLLFVISCVIHFPLYLQIYW